MHKKYSMIQNINRKGEEKEDDGFMGEKEDGKISKLSQ
jgi:hypothetical protein